MVWARRQHSDDNLHKRFELCGYFAEYFAADETRLHGLRQLALADGHAENLRNQKTTINRTLKNTVNVL